jgi:hypothetical protein
MAKHDTPAYWTNVGTQMGRERAIMDRDDGTITDPNNLIVPFGRPETFAQAYREAYGQAITNQHPSLDI